MQENKTITRRLKATGDGVDRNGVTDDWILAGTYEIQVGHDEGAGEARVAAQLGLDLIT